MKLYDGYNTILRMSGKSPRVNPKFGMTVLFERRISFRTQEVRVDFRLRAVDGTFRVSMFDRNR